MQAQVGADLRAARRAGPIMRLFSLCSWVRPVRTAGSEIRPYHGVYGMNFERMPVLHWRYGYAGIWMIMLTVGLGMVGFFKHKRWF
jgi:hypothetical protein